MLEGIRAEHETGARMLIGLRARLEAYQDDAERFPAFRDACHEYIDFERRHMAREERELLPLAARELRHEDWAEINAAFKRNDDPLFGDRRKSQFEALYRHILRNAPGPMGFGAPTAER